MQELNRPLSKCEMPLRHWSNHVTVLELYLTEHSPSWEAPPWQWWGEQLSGCFRLERSSRGQVASKYLSHSLAPFPLPI